MVGMAEKLGRVQPARALCYSDVLGGAVPVRTRRLPPRQPAEGCEQPQEDVPSREEPPWVTV